MRVWDYKTDIDNYQMLWVANPTDSKRFTLNFLGKPYPDPWVPLPVALQREWEEPGLPVAQKRYLSKRKHLPRGDFPAWPESSVAVFSDRALEVLHPLIQGSVEILPLECEGDRVHLINVIDVVDCLDKERSTIKWLTEQVIFRVTHYVFKEELLEGKHIFKMPGLLTSIYVSDVFKEHVETHDLKGLLWTPLP